MVRRADYNIDIFKLSNGSHQYEFDFDDTFFSLFEDALVEKGSGTINLELVKTHSFIELNFDIKGKIELICDRSLDPFWFPLQLEDKLMLKFGNDWEEISDEVLIMPRDEQTINIAQYIYEFIGVAVPMRKLHPRFKDEEEDDDSLYYSSDSDGNNDDNTIDPRWGKLKDLK